MILPSVRGPSLLSPPHTPETSVSLEQLFTLTLFEDKTQRSK